MRIQKCFYIIVMGCLICSMLLSGCSKEKSQEEINSSEDIASSEDIVSSEDIASSEDITSSDESGNGDSEGEFPANLNQGINGEIFVKLEQLEKLANEYKQKNPDNMDTASLLVAKYLRSGNENYQSADWNMLAGYSDEGFETYVLENGEDGLSDFRSTASVVDPGTGSEIEFSHLMASVNLSIRQAQMESEVEEPYVDYGSWGGDLLQLCREIKNEGMESSLWKEEMISRIGDENSSFNKNDLYADLDACNMKGFFEENMSLAQAFYRYYYSILEKSEMTRYQYFCENHFEGVTGEEELAQKMESILQDEEALIPQVLISTQNLDATEDAYLISTACEAFAQKIIENN